MSINEHINQLIEVVLKIISIQLFRGKGKLTFSKQVFRLNKISLVHYFLFLILNLSFSRMCIMLRQYKMFPFLTEYSATSPVGSI